MDAEHAVLNYGGGRQTIAIVALIDRGIIQKPAKIIMADTGRESPATFAYLAAHIQPLLARIGMRVEVIPPKLEPYPTTYGVDAKPLIPMFSRDASGDAKFSPFCTGNWKRDRMASYLAEIGWPKCERWIGFAFDEKKRVNRFLQSDRYDGYTYRFPLFERLIDTPTCLSIVESHGLPPPPVSRCWFCPHQKNSEWRDIRDNHPELWEAACREDEEQREQDLFRGGLGVWLHHSRMPLRDVDLTEEEKPQTVRQCSLGACFI